MIRSPPTSGFGCAEKSTLSTGCCTIFASRAARHGRTACGDRDAGLHAYAGRAARDFGHYLLAYCRDVHVVTRLVSWTAARGQLAAARVPPHWPAALIRSIAKGWRRTLGFAGICPNSLDAVSDRDFAVEFVACVRAHHGAYIAHGRRIVLWMNPRFGFIDLPDRFCTGSSIMPQKKTPTSRNSPAARLAASTAILVALLTLLERPAARLQQG
jgi:hypothetical protein